MKNQFLLILLLISSLHPLAAQNTAPDSNSVNGKHIEITCGKGISLKKVSLQITDGFGPAEFEYVTVKNSKLLEEHFFKNPGIFRIKIQYAEKSTFELMMYGSDTESEKLSFHFTQEGPHIFCRFRSQLDPGKNKLLVLE